MAVSTECAEQALSNPNYRTFRNRLHFLRKMANLAIRASDICSIALKDKNGFLRGVNKAHSFTELITMEGFTRIKQAEFFHNFLTEHPNIHYIAETGFNAGHSSSVFLGSRNDTRVVSFDVAKHQYVGRSKEYIDQAFPGRHELVLGDSKATVPEYARTTGAIFDLIFIDGGHDYETARADLLNFRSLACKEAFVIMDDYVLDKHYGKGPTKAWDEAVAEGIVVQEGVYSGDGSRWTLGRYCSN